jgi:hypothetical protein
MVNTSLGTIKGENAPPLSEDPSELQLELLRQVSEHGLCEVDVRATPARKLNPSSVRNSMTTMRVSGLTERSLGRPQEQEALLSCPRKGLGLSLGIGTERKMQESRQGKLVEVMAERKIGCMNGSEVFTKKVNEIEDL